MIAGSRLQLWVPSLALAAAILIGVLAFVSPLVALAVLVPLGAVILLTISSAAIPLLIVASALNHFGVQSGDAAIRVELIVALLLVIVLVDRIAVRTVGLDVLRSPLLVPLVGYGLINVFSTLLFAQERIRGLKLDAEIAVAILTYVVVVAFLRNRGDVERAVRTLWIVTVGEAALGLLLAAAYLGHISSFGVGHNEFNMPMVYGTQWEPNIFGSFLLGNFFILLADYARGGRSTWHTIGLFLILFGIGASLTRTVWLALLPGVVIFAVCALRVRGRGGTLFGIVAAVPILALVGLVVGSATPFASRFTDLVNLQSNSASGRLAIFGAALQEWQKHPLFGSGTGSFNVGASPGQPHPWLPNLFLLTLHDTGVVGFALLLLIFVAFYVTAFRGLRPGSDSSMLVAGSIAGVTALVIAFQSTSGFWFAYPWIVTGLGIAASRLARNET